MSSTHRLHFSAVGLLSVALAPFAWADRSGNATLAADTFLNLDNGAVSTSGGDILWNGSALMPHGHAGLFNLGKHGSLVFRSIPARYASSAVYTAAPIPAGTLVAGDVFGVHTNGGHYAKVLVTAASDGALSLRYTTFIAGSPTGAVPAASGSAPVVKQLQNNYSWILPGLPNYGIAPGSLFVIVGTGLSTSNPPVLQSSGAPGLPITLNQTSVSVTVKGVTVTPALYYTTSSGVAGVLPSNTPVGTGTVTVTYNGQTSASAPIQVVASAVGFDTLDGSGNGAAVATDANGVLLGLTNSAMPGQTVVLWGAGIGADLAGDDRTYPQHQANLTAGGLQIYIGGVSAKVLYGGRSPYPGVDQFNVMVPSGVSPGCFVSVVAMTGSVVSNTVTLPVTLNGGACSDPATGLGGKQIQSLAGKPGTNTALLAVGQGTKSNGTVNSMAVALMGSLPSAYFPKGYEYASQGSCIVVPPQQGNFNLGQATLDPGTIKVTGPSVSMNIPGQGGFYEAQLSAGPLAPGTYTFTGSGGKDIAAFSAAVTVQSGFALTNRGTLASIDRSKGATVTWSGAYPNSDVQVNGAVGGQFGAVRFYCHAPSSAGQLTIPPSILMAFPAGGGSLDVFNYSAATPVSASGLDVALAMSLVTFNLNSTFF